MSTLAEKNSTFFHASKRSDIDRFFPLSHFGTVKAAQDRAKSWDEAHLYEVEIDFTKALRVPDFMPSDNRSGLHTWMRLVDQLHYDVKPKAITSEQRGAVFSAGAPRVEGSRTVYDDQAACQALATMLSARWDALVYVNEFEDVGSTSLILLNPDKCRILSCEPLSPSAKKPRP